jgi:hypothetical protein
MRKLPLAVVILCGCIACGCGKQGDSRSSPGAVAKSGAEAESPGTQAAIDDLTKVLRRYSFEKRKVPQSLSEIVNAGYLQSIPEAPPGKKFAIDQKTVQVVLQKQ